MDRIIKLRFKQGNFNDEEKRAIYKLFMKKKDELGLVEKVDYIIKDHEDPDYLNLFFDYNKLDYDTKLELYNHLN